MTATDLRIGNFVWDDYSGEMIVANIWAERYPEVLVDVRKSNNLPCGRYDIDSIKPIPLTEEWLLKFGFDKTIERSYSTGQEVEYFVYKMHDLTYNAIQDTWWLRGVMNHYPIYVHQLQNLVHSLTGEELTIKL